MAAMPAVAAPPLAGDASEPLSTVATAAWAWPTGWPGRPARKPRSAVALKEFAIGRGEVVANLAECATPGEVSSADEIKPGEGAILRRGVKKIAACRDEDGKLIERSAVCTQVGCIVHWNGLDRCWDCPCHGAQFAVDGSVLTGPAVRSLVTMDQLAGAETG